MIPRPLIIDCDPGIDDAINLFLAMASPAELNILGLTTVAGNVALDLTTRNACIIRDIARRPDVAVVAGCAHPLQRALITAESIHGKTGLGEIDITTPKHEARSGHAVDFIIDTLLAQPNNSTTLVLTGPLTNAARAIAKERRILDKIADIVLMGGAMREAGNYSPSAEFNFLLDPHAADAVLRCGSAITMLGLDATHQVMVTAENRARIDEINNGPGRAVAQMLDFYSRNTSERFSHKGTPLHDPCTVGWLLQPDLFTTRHCNVAVEMHSELTMGHSAVDFWGVSGRAPNVNWVYEIDGDGFFELLIERLSRFSTI